MPYLHPIHLALRRFVVKLELDPDGELEQHYRNLAIQFAKDQQLALEEMLETVSVTDPCDRCSHTTLAHFRHFGPCRRAGGCSCPGFIPGS